MHGCTLIVLYRYLFTHFYMDISNTALSGILIIIIIIIIIIILSGITTHLRV